jgi:predicted RNA-binding protein
MKQNTPNFEPQCWLICTSQDNFQVDLQNNFSVEGFRARSRRLVSEVKPGDKFVIYINQLQRFGATLQATGKPYTDEKTRIWIEQEEIWPCRFPTKPIVVLEDDQLLDAKKLVTQLSFITDEQKRVNWGLAFHQSLRKIPLDDFELIESEMRKLLALRGKEKESRLLTEEQAKEAIMELPLEKKSLHDRIGEMLDTLGSRMGYNSYTNYRVTPEHAVELDVAWLDKRSPEIAIEVQIGGNLIEAKDKLAQAKKFNYRKVIMVIEQAQLPRLNAIIRFDELVDWMEAWSIQAVYQLYTAGMSFLDLYERLRESRYKKKTEVEFIC